MYNDIADLIHFYQTELGQLSRGIIQKKIQQIWPSLNGQRVLGLGYCSGYLEPFLTEASHVINCMPGQQGVTFWPEHHKNLSCLVDETELPFEDQAIDRVILVHSFDCTEQLHKMIREVWRVMTGNGRLIVVVPNRRGLWARFDHTPFGQGRSFSLVQLRHMLSNYNFLTGKVKRCLFMPPVNSSVLIKISPLIELFGSRFFPGLCGVYIFEATKQIYALKSQYETARRPQLAKAAMGLNADSLFKRDLSTKNKVNI